MHEQFQPALVRRPLILHLFNEKLEIKEGDLVTLSHKGLYSAEFLFENQLEDYAQLLLNSTDGYGPKLSTIHEHIENNTVKAIYLGYERNFRISHGFSNIWWCKFFVVDTCQVLWFPDKFITSCIFAAHKEKKL